MLKKQDRAVINTAIYRNIADISNFIHRKNAENIFIRSPHIHF